VLPPARLDEPRVAAGTRLVPLHQRRQQLVQLPLRLDDALRLAVRLRRALQRASRASAEAALAGWRPEKRGASRPQRRSLPAARTRFASVTAWSAIRRSSLALASVVSIRSLWMSCVTMVLRRDRCHRLGACCRKALRHRCMPATRRT
jgi:hypothetical protein